MISLKFFLLLFYFLQLFFYAQVDGKEDCLPDCKVLNSPVGIRPAQFRDCICVKSDEISENLCKTEYRSLKFRNETSGSIIRHQAVVAACVIDDVFTTIEQPEFEKDEQLFLKARSALDRLVNVERRYSNWVFGFRTNLISFYNVDDSTLRFGRK
ncbi:unnamed protein product, partial [Mesorhabditis belari]|uniref:Uncharacterized protein n=1 Tax=Mesorhabditis belari TaxID=2138241 RepID=A0AAF3EA69_9BILA